MTLVAIPSDPSRLVEPLCTLYSGSIPSAEGRCQPRPRAASAAVAGRAAGRRRRGARAALAGFAARPVVARSAARAPRALADGAGAKPRDQEVASLVDV